MWQSRHALNAVAPCAGGPTHTRWLPVQKARAKPLVRGLVGEAMLGRIAGRGRAAVRNGGVRADGTVREGQLPATATVQAGYQNCVGRASRPRLAGARRAHQSRTPASAFCTPSRALGSVAAADGADGRRLLGRGGEQADELRENAEGPRWRRAAVQSPEQARLRAKYEETGVCEACVQRRSDAWAELSGLHMKLQTKLAVGSTAVLPESWTRPMLIGRGVTGTDGVAMAGPPARWQLGRERCACCCGGERETPTRQQS